MREQKKYRYYDLIMAAFVTVILCSNLIGVHKVSSVNLPFFGEFIFGAGVLFFPIAYLFGDILTEVYGLRSLAEGYLGGLWCDDICVAYVIDCDISSFRSNNGC